MVSGNSLTLLLSLVIGLSSGVPSLQGKWLNALEVAAEMVGKGSGIWSTTELLIQTQQSAVQLQSGSVTGYWSGKNFAALQPPWPRSGSLVVTPGEELKVQVAAQGRAHPIGLLAACNGAYLLDETVRVLLCAAAWCSEHAY